MKNCATNERPQAQTTIGVIWEVTTTHQLNSKIFADVRLNIYNLSLDWLDWIYLVFFFRHFCWMRVNNLNLNLNNNIGQTFTPTLQSKTGPGSWVSTKVESIKCNLTVDRHCSNNFFVKYFRQIIANAKIGGYVQIFCFMGIGAQRGVLQLLNNAYISIWAKWSFGPIWVRNGPKNLRIPIWILPWSHRFDQTRRQKISKCCIRNMSRAFSPKVESETCRGRFLEGFFSCDVVLLKNANRQVNKLGTSLESLFYLPDPSHTFCFPCW